MVISNKILILFLTIYEMRAMKAQRKQMNARSLLNYAFLLLFHLITYNKRCRIRKKKAIPGTVQLNKLIAELPE